VFGRIDPIAAGGAAYRIGDECPNITVFQGEGRFVGDRVLEVNGEQITGQHIVLGAGARPFVPPFPGIEDVKYHTSDTVMRLETLPERLIVLGGGYIASELGHVFGGLGSHVTMINRSERLLRNEDDDISERFTEVYGRRFDLRLGASVDRISQDESGIHVQITRGGVSEIVEGDVLLVATGRVPNGDLLQVEAAGIAHDQYRVLVDEFGRTNVENVWAFGDLSNQLQLKHLANAEVKAVRNNILEPGAMISVDPTLTPHAVFGHPQVASVGMTERGARAAGRNISVASKDYGATAYGWAMEDEDSFCKLIADADTRLLLGAHIIGPQASTLLQQLVQGMSFGQTVDEMATGQMYTHPALTEVVENALLDL
jgi:mycothione reductase